MAFACDECGHEVDEPPVEPCAECGGVEWTNTEAA